jgi:hypothetical protein
MVTDMSVPHGGEGVARIEQSPIMMARKERQKAYTKWLSHFSVHLSWFLIHFVLDLYMAQSKG